MKTFLIALLVSMLMSVAVIAGVAELEKATGDKDPVATKIEAEKILNDSEATIADKAHAQSGLGAYYYFLKRYDEAILEWQKVLDDYPSVILKCAGAQSSISSGLFMQKKYAEAIVAWQKVITDYSYAPADLVRFECARAYNRIGSCYDIQGETEKAKTAYRKLLIEYPEQVRQTVKVFDKVDFASMTNEEVVTILERLLRATPSVAKNGAFLGRIKSDLEKFK